MPAPPLESDPAIVNTTFVPVMITVDFQAAFRNGDMMSRWPRSFYYLYTELGKGVSFLTVRTQKQTKSKTCISHVHHCHYYTPALVTVRGTSTAEFALCTLPFGVCPSDMIGQCVTRRHGYDEQCVK